MAVAASNGRPQALRVQRESIPPSLLETPAWVGWRYEQRTDAQGGVKWTKVPYQADGRHASSTDARTWDAWKRVWPAYERGKVDGVGIVLTAEDTLTGVDLDACIDPDTGELAEWAWEIVQRLDSYTERSPSGRGLRVFLRAEIPAEQRKGKHVKRPDGGAIELYTTGRYLTATGAHLDGTPLEAEERTAEYLALRQELTPKSAPAPTPRPPAAASLSGAELLERARRAKNGAAFSALYDRGDTSGHQGDDSRADLALCSILGFWTGGNPDAIDRLFRGSALYREKWERADYREATIDRALAGLTSTYSPGGAWAVGGTAEAPVARDLAAELVDEPENDSGNGRRFAARYRDQVRYVRGLGWLVWDGRRWRPDEAAVQRLAKATARLIHHEAALLEKDGARRRAAWAVTSGSGTRLREMLWAAQSEPGVEIAADALDSDPWLLCCANGTVDLRTGELRPHRREDLLTRMSPVRYDPDARSPLWERFIETVTGGDAALARFLQRAAGYSLTGLTTEEKLFFVHGPAASGKSTFMDAMRSVLGDHAATADFETFLRRRDAGGPRNDIARLAGARLVASIEVDEGKQLAEGLLKSLIGGDQVAARFLFKEAFEFTPRFKLWLVANHAPRVRDDDDAMWRRVLLLPFDHSIPEAERDPAVKVALRDVSLSGPAILAWAVRGCLEWQAQGLGVPAVVRAATDAYRADQDPIRDFLEDCCQLAPDAWAPTAGLRAAYEAWARAAGVKAMSAKGLAGRLLARGLQPERRGTGYEKVRGWAGIELLSPHDGGDWAGYDPGGGGSDNHSEDVWAGSNSSDTSLFVPGADRLGRIEGTCVKLKAMHAHEGQVTESAGPSGPSGPEPVHAVEDPYPPEWEATVPPSREVM